MNSILRLITITALVAPTAALATSWTCSHDKLTRVVSIETEAGSTACKVNYNKDSEGQGTKTLWNAANDSAYCTEKAQGLADKLTSLGWTCAKSGEATPAGQ